jgi:hypothetical protein
MRTTVYAGSLVLAAALTAPALAQTATTPIKPPDHQTSTQEMNKAMPQMTPGAAGQQGAGAAGGQGAGTAGTAGTGAAGAGGAGPAVKPQEHEKSATEDMTRAVPPMKPGEQGAGTGAAPGTGQPGGWTADQKLRETGKEGAVEKPGPGGAGAQPPAQQPSR